MIVRCWFCKELVRADLCKEVEVTRTLKSGEKEKMKVWRCMDCKDRQKAEKKKKAEEQ